MENYEETKRLFEENAHKLVCHFINTHRNLICFFGDFEDMYQELMLKAWKIIPLWDSSISKLSTYFYRCFTTICLMKIKKKNTIKRGFNEVSLETRIVGDLTILDTVDNSVNFDKYLIEKEQIHRILGLMKRETYLTYVCGYSMKEVAQIVNKPLCNVCSIIFRNKKKIREIFSKEKE